MLINRVHASLPKSKTSRSLQLQLVQYTTLPWGAVAGIGAIIGASAILGPSWLRGGLLLAILLFPYTYAARLIPALPTRQIFMMAITACLAGGHAYHAKQHFLEANAIVPSNQCAITAYITSCDFKPSNRFCYILRVNDVTVSQDGTAPFELPDLVEIYVRTPRWLKPGDYIRIQQIKLKPYATTKMSQWAFRHRLTASGFVNPEQITIAGKPKRTWHRLMYTMQMNLLKHIKSILNQHAYKLFKTIILGITHNSYATDQLRCGFLSWGLAHMLARSGLHMLLIASVFSIAALPLGTASLLFSFVNALAIALLSLFSWNGLSFVRAVLMWFLSRASIALRIRPNIFHTLGLVITGCILWEPAVILFLDFQLTFGVTTILALMQAARN